VVPSQILKLNCQALDLVNQMWAGLFPGRRDAIGVKYTGFEVVGASSARGILVGVKIQNQTAGARFWPNRSGGLV
jgi:hypothetical protein